MQNEIRAAADVPTLSATSEVEKGGELSENKNRAAKWQKHPRHTLIVAGRGLEEVSPQGVWYFDITISYACSINVRKIKV